MATELPEPLSLAWELKPVSSAAAGSETLPDGCTVGQTNKVREELATFFAEPITY